MSDQSTSPQSVIQESASSTITVVETVDEQDREVPTLKVKLKKPKNDKKVKWTSETVDNEHLNKKKSKCCCIYEKPRPFGESSSSSEDSDIECEHCKGHVERKKKKRNTGASTIIEQPQTITTTVLSDDPSNNNNTDKQPEKSDKNGGDSNSEPKNNSS